MAGLLIRREGRRGRRRRRAVGRHHRWNRALALLVFLPAATLAGLQGVGWYVNARHAAVGDHGPWRFAGHSLWSPPGHWLSWIVVAAAGTALLLAGTTWEMGRAWRRPQPATT